MARREVTEFYRVLPSFTEFYQSRHRVWCWLLGLLPGYYRRSCPIFVVDSFLRSDDELGRVTNGRSTSCCCCCCCCCCFSFFLCVCVCVLYFYAFAFSWALLSSCISQIRRLTTQKEGPQRDTEEKKQTKEMDGDVDGGVVNIRFPDARTSIGRISFFFAFIFSWIERFFL